MRAVFGILGLVVVLVVIGMLAKKQLTSVAAPPAVVAPGATSAPPGTLTPKQQMDQLKQGLESTLQQPREIPDEKK